MITINIAFIAIASTLAIFLANVIYRTGHLSARVEELERWRTSMRADMHEISDKIDALSETVRHLTTVIEERTERRFIPRTTTP